MSCPGTRYAPSQFELELIRWTGHIPAGQVSNDIVAHLDWLPTILAAAGLPDVKQQLIDGLSVGETTYRVHLDGYNLLPLLTGESAECPRKGFFDFSDDGELVSLRFDNWQMVFMEQRMAGTLAIWLEPFTVLRVPELFNLRTAPFERADLTSNTYDDWVLDHICLFVLAQALVAEFLARLQQFPPRQKAGSFSIQFALDKLTAPTSS